MDIKKFLKQWLGASNAYDLQAYLAAFDEKAILKDPSVGRDFKGHAGIAEYFESYFIGYRTQTRLVELVTGDNTAHLEVEFTGEFPGGQIGGTFDFTFKKDKIARVKAELI